MKVLNVLLKLIAAMVVSLLATNTKGPLKANYSGLVKDNTVFIYHDHDYVVAKVVSKAHGFVTVTFGGNKTRTVHKSKVYWKVPEIDKK